MSRLMLFMLVALLLVACGDTTATLRGICRGDSVRADFCDTCIVRCETLDSLAKKTR